MSEDQSDQGVRRSLDFTSVRDTVQQSVPLAGQGPNVNRAANHDSLTDGNGTSERTRQETGQRVSSCSVSRSTENERASARSFLKDPVVVVGGGPAGCLAALELSRCGFTVEVYESRQERALHWTADERHAIDASNATSFRESARRSINLALSARGIKALASVGLAERIHAFGVPMRGRMIHDMRGKQRYQSYGSRKDEYLLSVSRQELNQVLLEACELDDSGNITVYYGKKCVDVDLDHSVVRFEETPSLFVEDEGVEDREVPLTPTSSAIRRKRRSMRRLMALADLESGSPGDIYNEDEDNIPSLRSTPARVVSARHVTASFVVGADGAHSKVRAAMQRAGRFDYAQEYLPAAYKELHIPPREVGARDKSGHTSIQTANRYALNPHCLHIWPRKHFMLIALPNLDGSFTCTLFMNHSPVASTPNAPNFSQLITSDDIRNFFSHYFPDVVPIAPTLVDDFFANPVASLFTIRCNPFHHKGRAVLIGDAAHAIVPFFGQGCNAAFEDCRILGELLQQELRRIASSSNHEGKDARDILTEPRNPSGSVRATLGKPNHDKCSRGPAVNVESIFSQYTAARKPNTDAIAQLALENYVEMASKTASVAFRCRRRLENVLHSVMPSRFMSLYHMVSFSHIPYAETIARARRQDRFLAVLTTTLGMSGAAAITTTFYLAREHMKRYAACTWQYTSQGVEQWRRRAEA